MGKTERHVLTNKDTNSLRLRHTHTLLKKKSNKNKSQEPKTNLKSGLAIFPSCPLIWSPQQDTMCFKLTWKNSVWLSGWNITQHPLSCEFTRLLPAPFSHGHNTISDFHSNELAGWRLFNVWFDRKSSGLQYMCCCLFFYLFPEGLDHRQCLVDLLLPLLLIHSSLSVLHQLSSCLYLPFFAVLHYSFLAAGKWYARMLSVGN